MPLSTIQFGMQRSPWLHGTLLALLVATLLSLTIQAQSGGSFTLTQTVIAGGGGSGAGGPYKLDGTIGQPDTGVRTNGTFSLVGGFWGSGFLSNCPIITLSPATLSQGTVGVLYTQIVTASPSGDYTYMLSSGTLPTGITLTSGGTLTGTTAQVGSFPISITAKDVNGCLGTANFTLVIGNPIPNITSLNPTTAFVGGPAFTLTINGVNFVNGAVVKWNGANRTTAFISNTKLEASITAADLALVSMAQLTVLNPSPGGGLSNQVLFSVIELPTYEADVSPRPNGKGNGTVTVGDWVQSGRFVVGLDTPAPGSEFQRADCAPKATLGDGKISLTDWVQTGRYAAALDPVVVAGGPSSPVAPLVEGAITSPELTRTVRAANANFQRGQIGILPIETDALGNEMGLAFTLNFDPQRMSFVEANLGKGAEGAALVVNAIQAGKLGIALALPMGQSFAAGTQVVLNLRFIPTGGEGDATTTVSFSDQLVIREMADLNGVAVSGVTYVSAAVNITGKAVATVSAANYVGGEQAAESIVSAFGSQLAATTQPANSLPLPISLGGSQIVVRDSQGEERFAPLFYVSPNQINFQIPKDTAEGLATITVFSASGTISSGLLTIGKVAPALFSADSSGTGYAAGSALLVRADGSRVDSNLVRYDAATAKFVVIPIDLGVGNDQVYLTLYGTGLKNRSDLAQVKATIGGVPVAVEYAGAQGFFAGLDQVNLKLPASLKGKGDVNVVLEIQGRGANVVKINVK